MRKSGPLGVPAEVAAIREGISKFFATRTPDNRTIGSYLGVYVFFDYDEEPIYVGQTYEGLSGRVSRPLTNQRTDAVAMNVLDPFEVAWIEVYPLCHKSEKQRIGDHLQRRLNALEYTVFQKVPRDSALGAVLNEADIAETEVLELPTVYRGRIVPDGLFELRKHPDVRIARRAATIARLAQVISERDVSPGLRRTLVTQARRLERLAAERFAPFAGAVPMEKQERESD